MSKIIYTYTDEAPMLATTSFLPIVEKFLAKCGISVELADISLAGRIIAEFSDFLPPTQQLPNTLKELGDATADPKANIIKLPNISASLPQLLKAIQELRTQGIMVPEYPENPQTKPAKEVALRYNRVKGSAVNPVLREGNSDRRAPQAVKEYAKTHPHAMKKWETTSRTRVATMTDGDFRTNEQCIEIAETGTVSLVHVALDGTRTVLRENLAVSQGELFDISKMSKTALIKFLSEQIEIAGIEKLLLSLHLKATMMKVSDPIIFGHAVRTFLANTFAKHKNALTKAGINANNGLGTIFQQLDELPTGAEIKKDFLTEIAEKCDIAMVDSDRGITNLHVPSDIIIDASMPAMIRNGGQMWDKNGKLADTLAIIPDSSYAGVYDTVIKDCQKHGAFDPTTMGTVPNVGLMAQKAEEYGSHDKTFEICGSGWVALIADNQEILAKIAVEDGDIFRGCQTKDIAIQNWVELAVQRARITNTPAIFWLDPKRAHDMKLQHKAKNYLAELDTTDLEIHFMSPIEATQFSIDRIRKGQDTIAVTGNVLRDYLTDLFPILEVGTSAKMLSVVPLLAGGGLFETGAGGSAPKHIQQLIAENHLRWDSLGEFLALAESLRQIARQNNNMRANIMADCLDKATAKVLNENKSPQRKVGELDTRNSHAWLTIWWAQYLAEQIEDLTLANEFATVAKSLLANSETIEKEILTVQGKSVDLGGYYHPHLKLTTKVMRPSSTFNQIINTF